VLAVFAVSTAAILIRGASAAPPLTIAAYRLVLGALLFVFPVFVSRGRSGRPDRRTLLVAVLAGVFLAGHFATWIASLAYTSVASSIALVTAHPLVVALGSRLLFGERVTRRVWAGIGVGVAGVVALAFVDHGASDPAGSGTHAHALLGDLLAFAGCIFVAGYFFCGRWARDRVSLVSYVAVAYGTAAVALLALALVTAQPMVGFPPETFAAFLLLALVPQGVGHTLVNRSLRAFPAPIVSLAILGEVPLSTLMAWALLGESVPPARLAAVCVIVLAVAVAVAEPSRIRRSPAPVG